MSENPSEGIAIIGMAGRFPGAPTLADFWRNLRQGVESITFFSDAELLAAGVPEAALADPRYVKAKGVLAGVERFDPAFFGLTPREGEILDPQHRVFLECAWEAIERAGYDTARFPGRVAVYGGAGSATYLLFNLLPDEALLARVGTLQAILSNEGDFLTTRVSYELDLRGPSAQVQTACSTALVAVHMACQSLLAGECDMALAGGVSIDLPQTAGYLFQESGVMSPDGHCRAFDARAAGTVNGSGAGVVLLKSLERALADGDTIHAVIKGSAVNNDGAGKIGFTAPSVTGQAEAITESLLLSGVDPATIAYVEAHGSGTALGDPVEIAALTQAFRDAGATGTGFCAVGSVKTNIGHCNAAAGVAGLLKTVLAIEAGEIPPSLHFTAPNPQIDFAASPFHVSARLAPWPERQAPRRAGVSSFGLGGTNAHLVLEAAPAENGAPRPSRGRQLLVLSARTVTALDAMTAALAADLQATDRPSASGDPGDLAHVADIAYTLQVGRRRFAHRRAVVVPTAGGAAAAAVALADPARVASAVADPETPRQVAFLLPGLGDQYVDMARELYDSEAAFRAEVDRCAEILAPHLGLDLRQALFSPGPAKPLSAAPQKPDLRALLRRDAPAPDPAAARLARTEIAQPACFVVEYALARLLIGWGVVPQAMIGYSLGEYVAACLAGVLTLEDALRLVALRAQLIQALPAGAMLAVPLAAAEVAQHLSAALSVSATNGPCFSVVGGPPDEVDRLAATLTAEGVSCLRLNTTHAFHSAMMQPAVAAYVEVVRGVTMRPPQIPYLSNVTGTWVTAGDLADPAYWARHMRQTVRFAEGVAELLAGADRVLFELGPGGTLGTLAKQHPDAGPELVTLSALRRAAEPRSDVEHLLEALGRLFLCGAEIDWTAFWATEERRRVPLPTYPFERRRCWIDPPAAGGRRAAFAAPGSARDPERASISATAAGGDPAEWLSVPVWNELPPVSAGSAPAGPDPVETGWLVFLDRHGLGAKVAERLRRDGSAVETVEAGAGFNAGRREDYDALVHRLAGRRADGRLPNRILHLFAVGLDAGSFAAVQESGLASLVLLAQAIAGAPGAAGNGGEIRLAAVASGTAAVADGEEIVPARATLAVACKVLHQEAPRLVCRSVDVALPAPGSPAEERLAGRLIAELSEPGGEPVAWRGGRRFVRSFAPLRLPAAAASQLRPAGAYLVTGAAEPLGLAIAEALVGEARSRVALVLPAGFPAREEWSGLADGAGSDPVAADPVAAAVRRLLALGEAACFVVADTGSAAGARAAVAQALARLGGLDGIFHAPGPFAGGLVQLTTAPGLAAALLPVAHGSAALLAAAEAAGPAGVRPFVALLSSTLAVTGGLGQLETAAAGAYLDAVAERERGRSEAAGDEPRVFAIHWDPYQWGGWLAGGVGLVPGMAPEAVAKDLAENSVAVGGSFAALRALLSGGAPRVVVSARELGRLLEETDAFTAQVFLAEMEKARRGGAAHPRSLSTPYQPPAGEVELALATLWQELFGVQAVGRDDDFLELGGHSLLAIQMITQIRSAFAVDLPVTVLFESPTVARLAAVIGRRRGPALEEEDPAELERLLAAVEGLSPEEARGRMAEELGGS